MTGSGAPGGKRDTVIGILATAGGIAFIIVIIAFIGLLSFLIILTLLLVAGGCGFVAWALLLNRRSRRKTPVQSPEAESGSK